MKTYFQKNWFLLTVIAVLAFAAYFSVTQAPFKTLDDEFSIIKNKDIKDFSNLGKIFTTSYFQQSSYYRPLVSVSYMLEYHLFGLNPAFFYLTNILIHIATAFSIFFLVNLFFKKKSTAFFVALLFAIHPVNWEAVANIPGRSILLCSFFYVNTFLFFCLSRAGGERKKNIFCTLSLLFFMCSLLSKESAGILPLMMASYLWFMERKDNNYLKLFAPLIPYFIIILAYVILRKSLGLTSLFYWQSMKLWSLGVMTFLRSVITHWRLFIFPVDLHFDRALYLYLSFFDISLLLTFAFWLTLIGAVIKFRKKIPNEILFLMSWFCIDLLPVSQILVSIGVQPGYISTAEHFLYLPSISMFVLLTLFGQWVYRKNKEKKWLAETSFNIFVGGIFLLFFFITVEVNVYASNEITMFQRTLKFAPHNVRIRNSLALALARLGLFDEAEFHFRRSLRADPLNVRAKIGLGKSLVDQGKYWEGIQEYEGVVKPGPLSELLQDNMDKAHEILIGEYQKKLEDDPENARMQYSLGVMYTRTGQFEEAVERYRKAISLKPRYKNALFNLAGSYYALGQFKKSVRYFESVIDLDGEEDEMDLQTYVQLSIIYLKLGDEAKSQKYAELADNLSLKQQK